MRRGGDRVTIEVHARVLQRDRVCFLWRIDNTHICKGRYGRLHEPGATWMLTVDHVKDEPMMGKRAPSDEWHLVAMCWSGNVSVPSKEVRMAERAYLSVLRRASTIGAASLGSAEPAEGVTVPPPSPADAP